MANEKNLIPAKAGEIRNPNGRTKGSKNRSTIARYWLGISQKVKNPLTGKEQLMSQEDLITLALINKAIAGDVPSYKSLMDSGYGAPVQQVETVSSVDFKDSTIVFE